MLIIQFPYMEIVWLAFKKKFCEKKLLTINSTAGKTFKRFLGCYNWNLWLFQLYMEIVWLVFLVIPGPWLKCCWILFSICVYLLLKFFLGLSLFFFGNGAFSAVFLIWHQNSRLLPRLSQWNYQLNCKAILLLFQLW